MTAATARTRTTSSTADGARSGDPEGDPRRGCRGLTFVGHAAMGPVSRVVPRPASASGGGMFPTGARGWRLLNRSTRSRLAYSTASRRGPGSWMCCSGPLEVTQFDIPGWQIRCQCFRRNSEKMFDSNGLWRRVPESNRSTRICNPLRNLSANPPEPGQGIDQGALARKAGLELWRVATACCRGAGSVARRTQRN